MTDWAALRHAYGPADDIPGLLAAAEIDPDNRQAWDDLWSRLCHQGTIYSASLPALPTLAVMTTRRPAGGYVEPLQLAAAIVAANDGPEDFADLRRDYSGELLALRDRAEQNLPLADGFVEFAHGLQALMAFEGSVPWNRELEALVAEELTLECTGCDEYLAITVAEPPATTTAMDDDLPVTAVVPAEPDQLRGAAARIYALALQHGQITATERLPYLFGTTTCPACGIPIDLPQALAS